MVEYFECTITILGKIKLKGNSGKGGAALFGNKSTFILQAREMIFEGNVATEVGGAIYLDLSNLHSFSNSLFDGNSATKGGAIHVDGKSQMHLYNNTRYTQSAQ